jgi:hypothetical protein
MYETEVGRRDQKKCPKKCQKKLQKIIRKVPEKEVQKKISGKYVGPKTKTGSKALVIGRDKNKTWIEALLIG